MYFAYDYINENEQICRRVIQQMMGRLFGMGGDVIEQMKLTIQEEKVVRRMKQFELETVTPREVAEWTGLEKKTARKLLKGLVDKEVLAASDRLERVRKYTLEKDLSKFIL
ncbi:hypothetical protein [Paenibacillus alkalitolerans]|uniref:hypothetical protein n=1 Tax=Paenibacillus alkalitolerans TaxID=2799335 RepID=UPI0018F7359A|nr:hypothetical protein [Paenibacillus alkalitolerans]